MKGKWVGKPDQTLFSFGVGRVYIAPPRTLSDPPPPPLLFFLSLFLLLLHIYICFGLTPTWTVSSLPSPLCHLGLHFPVLSPSLTLLTKMKTSISSDVWEKKKALIARLYMEEEWPLKQVIKQIRSDDFNPR